MRDQSPWSSLGTGCPHLTAVPTSRPSPEFSPLLRWDHEDPEDLALHGDPVGGSEVPSLTPLQKNKDCTGTTLRDL